MADTIKFDDDAIAAIAAITRPPKISYAQNFEDVLLFRALGSIKKGFYIDIGANDPLDGTVTRMFYDLGWRGINVEPSPSWFEKIKTHRLRDTNLNIAVTDEKGEQTFFEIEGTGLSSFNENYANRAASFGFGKTSYSVQTDTLAAICAMHAPRDIHFLKIDTEGAEESVLRGADFTRFRPWIILVEAVEPVTTFPSHESWDHLLIDAGYEFALFDGLNRFYVAREHADLKKFFVTLADSYVKPEKPAAPAPPEIPRWRQLASSIAHRVKRPTDNPKSTQIALLYEVLLGRKVDDQGMTDWLGLWESQPDWNISKIADLIMTSSEFRTRLQARQEPESRYKVYPYFDSKLALNPDDWILQEIVQGGIYERYVLEAFLELMTPETRVLDLGANAGTFTIAAAQTAKHVFAVEMMPENAKILAINVHLNNMSNVTILPCGVADVLGPISFKTASSTAIVEDLTITLDNHEDLAQALGVPLDTILELSTPDIIKIDIEGYEYKAIAPSKLIWKQRPTVFIEFCPQLLRTVSGIEPEILAELFFSNGYSATILLRDMTREAVGQNLELLMTRAREYESLGITHLDIMMTPD